MRHLKPIFLVLAVLAGNTFATPIAHGPYLGQTPPGLTGKIFAPGIICEKNRNESSGSISADEKTFCFRIGADTYITEQTDEGWTPLQRVTVIPSGGFNCYLAPDGKAIYFSNSAGELNVCKKTDTGWASPEKLPKPVNKSAGGFSLAADNSFYFCSWKHGGYGKCDVWYSPYVNGTWGKVINIKGPNTKHCDCGPAIAPDQSFMVIWSNRPGGLGKLDLYVSLHLPDGSWSEAKNLGPKINSPQLEVHATISPDGKYLFYSSRNDIYWVSVKAFLPDPNGPIINRTKSQHFDSILCAINYAEPR